MRLNRIVLTLSLLVILSSSTGGYLYFSSLHQKADKQVHQEATTKVRAIANRISLLIAQRQQSIEFLSKLDTISDLLTSGSKKPPEVMEKVDFILDQYRESMQADVCYLMNKTGVTIASSNRNNPASFEGKNYSFRPYFQEAIAGNPYTYMALGVTSGKRGLYFSHPIYHTNHREAVGVIVAKFSIHYIDIELSQVDDGVSLLTDPHGIIFSSSRPDWLFKSLWPLENNAKKSLAANRQFGKGGWIWTGVTRLDMTHAIDRQQHEYMIHEVEISHYPGWKIVYLHDLEVVSGQIFTPLFKMAGFVILVLCLFIGLIAAVLYRKAENEIRQRKLAEEEVLRLNQELEVKVDQRTQELKNAQERLLRKEKLEVMGQLAGSVAHDLRNPLGAISNAAYLLNLDLGVNKDENIKKHLAILDKAVQKAESITGELLQFSRTSSPKLELADINEAIIESIAESPIPENITLIKKLSQNLPPSFIDRKHIQQMLSNLISNACQFMPDGGTLTISSELAENGNEIKISDTGSGIPIENRKKIFEPLFTTRSNGSGLGMAIVKDIITKHNGRISIVDDQGNSGATFRIILPFK